MKHINHKIGLRNFIIAVFVLMVIMGYPYLSETMPRHQVIQIPMVVSLGLSLAASGRNLKITDQSSGIAILILVMASLTFWMLPYYVDMSAMDKVINALRLLHLFICGTLIVAVWRESIFEVKIAFVAMLTSMTAAVGLAMKKFNVLLCSSFTIPEQQETGTYLLYISAILFLVTIYFLFQGWIADNTDLADFR